MAKKSKQPVPTKFNFERQAVGLSTGARRTTWEYEVAVDSHFVGECDYGPFRFGVFDIGQTAPQAERSLYFRIPTVIPNDLENIPGIGSPVSMGEDEPSEFASLFSLATRRRFRVLNVSRINDSPRRLKSEQCVHPQLFEDAGNIADAVNILHLVAGLRDEFKQRFALATSLYALALRLTESQTEQAFLNLVSAIEALSSTYEIPDDAGYTFGERLDGLFSQISDPNLAETIKKELWQTSMSTRKFVSFTLDHLEPDFWDSPERPQEEFMRVNPDDLEKLLKRMYSARSKLLHEGIPVCPSLWHAVQGAEIAFGLSIGHGSARRWRRNEFIPHISFIERMIQHVLMTFLRRNQTGQVEGEVSSE